MGSITKAPTAPAPAPTPVYYYVPTTPSPTPGADTGTNTGTNTGSGDTPTTPAQDKEAREQNLLRRDRGRLGTILSSFRGILGLSDNTPARKTLLGE